MASNVTNCKRCNGLFQKKISEFCPGCILVLDERLKITYRTLQRMQPGSISIEELAQQLEISAEDIDYFYQDGQLGTASANLRFQCLNCNVIMDQRNKNGHYCRECSEAIADKAGVEVKSMKQIEREDREAQRKAEQAAMLKRNVTKTAEDRRFGFANRYR
ncbi:MAG: hypothetical protein AB7P76_04155 [Candidatus Melainabacteria bacterium]